MKRTALLHADLSRVIASLGHGDMLVIGDAGLPIPAGPERIDLALMRGVPSLAQVLAAVLSEMQVESAVIATEAMSGGAGTKAGEASAAPPSWYPACLPAPATLDHEAFKAFTARARAVVRTGECTPYANIVLVAGVWFGAVSPISNS